MKYSSQHKQLSFDVFPSSLSELSKENCWVKLGDSLPWNEIEKIYNRQLNNTHGGAGNKAARMIIGALLIKRKMDPIGRTTSERNSLIRERRGQVHAIFQRM